MTIKTEPKLLRRAVATVIDYGLYFMFFIWLVVTHGTPNNEGGYTLSNDPKGWWIFIVWIVYFPVVESVRGQTLGKLLVGLRVVARNGQPISIGQAFKRHLVDMIDLSFFGIVALITIKNTPDHQRVGDLWAGTIVIGGESVRCSHCQEELVLSPAEMIDKEFSCPVCAKMTKM